MTRRILSLVAVALFALVFLRIAASYTEQTALRPLADFFVTQGPLELGAPNVVTGILLSSRGFDTLGEVAVLFMVAAAVGLLLKPDASAQHEAAGPPPSEIVRTGTKILLPVIFTFGAYVIANGHLSAGGGFQGGAIVASGAMLIMLGRPDGRLDTALLGVIESFAGIFYVAVGLLGLALAGGFLDPRFLPRGEFGAFISAGAIPITSALLGVKVGAELSVIIARFRA